MFPGLGERVIEAGNDKIRIKYCCPSIKVHIHRDIMAAENMADMLVYEINGLSRPESLSRQSNCKKVTEKSSHVKYSSPSIFLDYTRCS
jgi:hypothetical protein